MFAFRLAVCPIALLAFLIASGFAQDVPQAVDGGQPNAQKPGDLSIPPNADLATLEKIIEQAKAIVPDSQQKYQVMQTTLRDASQQIVQLLENEKESPRYQQAELDVIAASVGLMAYVGEDAKQKTLQKVHAFLSSRSKLSIQDVQTGMLAAAMLEFQADKKPARDTYQLLSDLLEDDEREEMQSLRLNLQASIRRLELLGKKFEILAKSLGGSEIKIDDYAGKYVVVDFFASWCEPCLADVTRLKKYYDKHHARGLEVIGISLDVDGESLTQFLDRTQLPWPIVHDNAENPLDRLQMKFGVLQLPTVFLLNKEGQVISLEAHGAELERWIERLFESPTPAPPAPQP